MPIQSNTEPSDSPKESDFNCEVPSLIFSPKKKVFEPGTTLTASMPVFTPAPIDKEILIPGYDFQK